MYTYKYVYIIYAYIYICIYSNYNSLVKQCFAPLLLLVCICMYCTFRMRSSLGRVLLFFYVYANSKEYCEKYPIIVSNILPSSWV